jgi:alpha-L-fucosidase
MKSKLFIVAVVVLAASACKPTYKATDRPMPAKDSTTAARDTAAAMNKMPATDSTKWSQPDSSRMDSIRQLVQDSAKIIAKTDSMLVKQPTDSAMHKPNLDSGRIQPVTDSVKMQAATQAPAAVESVFTKQYPGAVNIIWSPYDSLAAVPIDLRMAGWKKMDADDYMVKFDYKGENYYAWYNSDGKWIGSAYTMKDVTKLPATVNTAVKNAMKTRYSGYSISQVNREFQTGKTAYEVELAKGDSMVRMLVSSVGKITQIFKYASEAK